MKFVNCDIRDIGGAMAFELRDRSPTPAEVCANNEQHDRHDVKAAVLLFDRLLEWCDEPRQPLARVRRLTFLRTYLSHSHYSAAELARVTQVSKSEGHRLLCSLKAVLV